MSGDKSTAAQFAHWLSDQEQWGQLAQYMQEESRLPGPRVNLELSDRFAQQYAGPQVTETAWQLLTDWAGITEAEAGTNDPREFLPFCAVRALGAYYGYAADERRSVIRGVVKTAMNDSRWRMREAAAMGLQSIGETDFPLLQELLDMWIPDANMLEQRAFVAALAHPPLLKAQPNALYALDTASGIMEQILAGNGTDGDPEHFRILSKGLEYSLSVFAANEPEAGFAMLGRFAASGDARIVRIVKSNLGKTRLSKKYAREVAEILNELTIV